MTCLDIDGLITASLPLTSPEAAAHIAGCKRCRRLARALGDAAIAAAPSPEQLEHIEANVLAGLKPVSSFPPAASLWFALLFVVAVVVAMGRMELGIAGWLALGAAQKIAVFTVIVAAICLLASSAVRQIVPGARQFFAPGWLVSTALAALTGIFAMLFRPHAEPAFVATGLVCLRIGLECAVPSSIALWLLLRRGAILKPVWTGATTGTLAGLSGLAVLEIFCPNLNKYHILVWHMGAALTSALGGLAVGIIAEYSGWKRADAMGSRSRMAKE